jgi:soluble lytic murein transglycosylase-like protein
MPVASVDPSAPYPFHDEIVAAATKYGIDPSLLAAVVKQESNFNPRAQSGVGAKGLTQLMDATAHGLGVTDSFDPKQSLDGGAKFLSGLLKQFHGDESLALAAYNAGPGAVQKYGGIPPYQETQRYVPKVLGYAAQFRRISAAS